MQPGRQAVHRVVPLSPSAPAWLRSGWAATVVDRFDTRPDSPASFGLKPQRGRVPVGDEHASGWHGLVVLGPLTRSVRDAACFLDIASAARASTTFRDALEERSSRLRIAVSTNPIRSPVWAGRSPTGHSDGRSGDRRRSLTRSTGYSTAQTLCSHRCAKRQHRSSTTAPPAEDAIASSSEHLSLARTLERDRTARTRRPDGPQRPQHANVGPPRRPTQ